MRIKHKIHYWELNFWSRQLLLCYRTRIMQFLHWLLVKATFILLLNTAKLLQIKMSTNWLWIVGLTMSSRVNGKWLSRLRFLRVKRTSQLLKTVKEFSCLLLMQNYSPLLTYNRTRWVANHAGETWSRGHFFCPPFALTHQYVPEVIWNCY